VKRGTLRRTAFKRKATKIARSLPDAPRKPGLARTSTLGIGKKGLAWAETRSRLKIRFEAWGITECEANLAGCARDDYLGFMHRMKRRKITTQEELETVALACNFCHDKIEALSPEGMFEAVTKIIEARDR
jgi:hypothetical protein